MTSIMKLFSVALLLSLHSYTTAQTNKMASKKIDSTFASYNSKTPGVAVDVVICGCSSLSTAVSADGFLMGF